MVVKREKSILIEVGESMGTTRNDKRFNIEPQLVACLLRLYETSVDVYLPGLTSSGALSLKLSADRAGRTISLFQVNAAPPAPAPAPAAAPIAAPFPPPAMPPMMAPSAVPPPAITAVRFPLPFSVRLTAEVSIGCSVPFTVIEFSLTSNRAPPLNLPKRFASTTVPRTDAPAAIAVLPSTVTAEASVALKD